MPKFHDGSAISADDVVYSFKRVLAIGKGPSGAFKPVLKPDNITAPDKDTVRFKLETPYAPFLSAIPIVMIVNPRVLQAHESNGDWARGLAGLECGGLRRLSARRLDLSPPRARRPQTQRGAFQGWQDNPKALRKSRSCRPGKPPPACWRCCRARSI